MMWCSSTASWASLHQQHQQQQDQQRQQARQQALGQGRARPVCRHPGHPGLLAPSLAWPGPGLCQALLLQHQAWGRTARALVRCPCHLLSTQQAAQQARRAHRGSGLSPQLARHP